jgi:hypothetical protein
MFGASGERGKVKAALDRALRPGGSFAAELAGLGDASIETTAEARALASALVRHAPALKRGRAADGPTERFPSTLHRVVGLFQSIQSREAYDVLCAEGVPILLDVFDDRLDAADPDETVDLLLLLKVVSMYRVEGVIARVVAAARSPAMQDGPLWSVVFSVHGETHPYRVALLNRLRDPLPEGFAGVAYLDFANAAAREGVVVDHPFNSPPGIARLRSWLTSVEPDSTSCAASASAALAFIDRPARDELLALGMDHADAHVQLESASSAARLGSEAAVRFLARACLDHRSAWRAAAFLEALGRGESVPAEAREPSSRAIAEMSSWLAHPAEFGRPPDAISVADSRELNWPPTSDRRRLWVVRYRYERSEPTNAPEEGYGLVGSKTFALFDECTAELDPRDVYALHCCWELQTSEDPRAPKERTVEAGRAILLAANPGGLDGPN